MVRMEVTVRIRVNRVRIAVVFSTQSMLPCSSSSDKTHKGSQGLRRGLGKRLLGLGSGW